MVKLAVTGNENYAATVVRVRNWVSLPGLDNLVGVPFFGFQALTTRADLVGDGLYLLFTAETQLSEEYARYNNLHRHGNRNADQSKVGYLDDNRRVKALKLRGHRSSALLMPLESVLYALRDLDRLADFKEIPRYVSSGEYYPGGADHVTNWNDNDNTTYDQIIGALDRAIATFEEDQ